MPGLLGFPQTKERYCFRALYLEHGDRVEIQRLAAQMFEIRIAATAARRAGWPGFIPTDVGDVGEWYSFSTHDASADVKLIGWQPGDRVVAFDGADWKVLL